MPRNGMLRIHASLAAAVDGSSAVARATNTARATKARFMGLPFIIKRERLGAGEDQKRRLHTSVHNRSGSGWVPCSRSQVGRGRAAGWHAPIGCEAPVPSDSNRLSKDLELLG